MLTAFTTLALLALLGWLFLLGGHGWFWLTDQRLPRVSSRVRRWPPVTAVVPARDEAAMLPETLPSLLTQDYPGELTVVLVDDQSGDGTAAAARALAHGREEARELVVVEGSDPPPGWAGKVWAMAQGAEVAAARTAGGHTVGPGPHAAAMRSDPWAAEHPPAARPGYVLFTDADVAHAPGSVTVLVRSQALADAGGLERIRGARIDDVALGQLLGRGLGGRLWLGFGEHVASHRPYPELADLWNMIARSAYTQLRYSPWLLSATVAGLVLLFAVPPLAAAGGLIALAAGAGIESSAGLIALVGVGAWAAMSATWVPMLRLYRLSPLRAPMLPLVAMLYAAMAVDSARRHRAGQGGVWKGRALPRRPTATV